MNERITSRRRLAEIVRLKSVVADDPGCPDYPRLASLLLDQGDIEAARQVCSAGFEANPANQDGAITYLKVLRLTRALATAEEVFRRAAASGPPSPPLLSTWALLLLDAGRLDEARRMNATALQEAPEDRLALALSASLAAKHSRRPTTREESSASDPRSDQASASDVAGLPTLTPPPVAAGAPAPTSRRPPFRQRHRKLWAVALSLGAALAGLALGGLAASWFLRVRAKAVSATDLQQWNDDTLVDTLSAYHQVLDDAESRGLDGPASGVAALMATHLWLSNGHGTREAVSRQIERVYQGPERWLAESLIALGEGRLGQASKLLLRTRRDAGGWHRAYASAWLAFALGDGATLRQQVMAEMGRPRPAVAILLLGLRQARISGDHAMRQRLLSAAKRSSPAHPEVLLESALSAADQPAALEAVRRATSRNTAHSVRDQAEAWLARGSGKNRAAIMALDRARAHAPGWLDLAWLAALWRLDRDGSVSDARAILAPRAQALAGNGADVWLTLARVEQALARPHAALEALSHTGAARSAAWRQLHSRCTAQARDRQLQPEAASRDALAALGRDRSEAIRLARAAVAESAGSVGSRLALVEALRGSNRAEAHAVLTTIVGDQPTAPAALTWAGRLALQLAPSLVRQIVEGAMPRASSVEVAEALAPLARKTEQTGRWRQLVKVLHRSPSPSAQIEVAWLEVKQHQLSSALNRLRALAAKPIDDPELALLMVEALASAGDFRLAYQIGRRVLQTTAERGQDTSTILVRLGRQLARGDAWAMARAEELLFQVCRTKDAPAAALLEYGNLFRRKGDSARAIWSYREALRRDAVLAVADRELNVEAVHALITELGGR